MIQERIRLLMQSRSLNPTQFADEIGVQRSSISHILSGRNNPSLDIVTKILNRFPDIDSNWLVLGKGSLVQNYEPNPLVEKNTAFSELSETAKTTISNTLFDDIQEEAMLETPKNSIEDLQRKIEYLEKRSYLEPKESEIKDELRDISNLQKEDNQKREEKAIENEGAFIQKVSDNNSETSNLFEENQSDNSKRLENQSTKSRRILKIIVLYSDSTYEELIKN